VGIAGAQLDSRVVLRDIYDIINTGHWQNFAQAHHFMRRFDRQTPFQAYEEGVSWIRTNARQSSTQLYSRIGRYVARARNVPTTVTTSQCQIPPMHPAGHRAMLLYTGSATEGPGTLAEWQSFGNALHALQDSFAGGHVRRAVSNDPQQPGAIEHILRYRGDEKEGHSEADGAWRGGNGQLSTTGRMAANASKALIGLVLTAALNNYRGVRVPGSPFEQFQQRWLAAAPTLSNAEGASAN
jgi:hypothetical protein